MENIEESMDDSFEDETWKPQTNENDYSKDSSNGESDSDQSERAPRGKCTMKPRETEDIDDDQYDEDIDVDGNYENVPVLNTPTKVSPKDNTYYLNASRALGCYSPSKDNVHDSDSTFYCNLSALLHCYFDYQNLDFGAKPISLKMMKSVMDFGGVDRLNLFKGKVDITQLYFEKLRNGLKNESIWAGNKNTGFLDINGYHRPTSELCPFQHCKKLKEFNVAHSNDSEIQNMKNAETPDTPKTPDTPNSMRVMIQEYRMKTKNLKRNLYLEEERSTTFLNKLHTAENPSSEKLKRFQCQHCTSSFTRIDSLQRHLKNHFKGEKVEVKKMDDVVLCKFCHKRLSSRSMSNHLKVCKGLTKLALSSPNRDSRSGLCPFCKKYYSRLERHIIQYHKCKICMKSRRTLHTCAACSQYFCQSCIVSNSLCNSTPEDEFCINCATLPGIVNPPTEANMKRKLLGTSTGNIREDVVKMHCSKCDTILENCMSCSSMLCNNCSILCLCGCGAKTERCLNCTIDVLNEGTGSFNQLSCIPNTQLPETSGENDSADDRDVHCSKCNMILIKCVSCFNMLCVNCNNTLCTCGCGSIRERCSNCTIIVINADTGSSKLPSNIPKSKFLKTKILMLENNNVTVVPEPSNESTQFKVPLLPRIRQIKAASDLTSKGSTLVHTSATSLSSIKSIPVSTCRSTEAELTYGTKAVDFDRQIDVSHYKMYQLSESEELMLVQILTRIKVIEESLKEKEIYVEEDDESYITRLMTDYGERNEMTSKKDQRREKQTIPNYIRILNRDGFPWLKERLEKDNS